MKDEWSETDDWSNSEIYGEESLYSYVIRYLDQALPELNEQEDPDFRDILFDLYDEEIDNCTRTIEIKVDCSPLHVLSCLSQNPVYHELAERTIISEKEQIALHQEELRKKQEAERLEAERKARLQESILHAMPDAYPNLYPLARKMKRHFILHIGPTNSGKTYAAMQRLREVGEGIYLAPLRLLAYEQYEKLNADDLTCSLITGEEQEVREGANIQASTVEMMDPVKEYPVAVIDEAQMIGDESRGWAWTAAILGICCPEIHVCAAPFAKNRLESLIMECGDTFEVIWHERQTKLTKSEKAFQFPGSVQKHDALIVFSKKNVHAVAYELRKRGVTCSIIYGNLPYDVRQAEARRFVSGETDILVSTDAIGMGLNLPIQRVVFLEDSKFDGKHVRELKAEEVQQIAGRAGRMGIFDQGYYATAGKQDFIKRKMEENPAAISKAVIGFPPALTGLDAKLSEIIRQWEQLPVPVGYKRMNTSVLKQRVSELESRTENKKLIYGFASMPFGNTDDEKRVWKAMFYRELSEEGSFTIQEAEKLVPLRGIKKLDSLEIAYKVCDLLYNYFTRFCHPEEIDELLLLKKDRSYRILEQLSNHGLEPKKCKYCGKDLPWNYSYSMCEKCHRKHYKPSYFDYGW